MIDKLLGSETRCSLLDQCMVSGGNFLTTLVLARLLAPANYGTFSLLFLSLFAINTCHTSLVIYPLTLRAASANASQLGELAGAAVLHTLLLGLPLAALTSLTAFLLHRADLCFPIALAMVCWQLQEAARRVLLAAMRSREAIVPDMFCYVGQAIILIVLRSADLRVIFLVVAVTSLLASCWEFILVRLSMKNSFSREYGWFAWNVGRFAFAGNSLNMIALQIPGWTLLLLAGPAAVAGYQSLLNLVGIANPIIFSVSNLLIPAVARVAPLGVRHARRTVVHYGIRYTALLLPGLVVLFLVPHLVMRLIYGVHSHYLGLAPLLRPFVVAFALQYAATVVGAYEGGMSRPKTYMWVQIISTAILLSAGVALIHLFGVAGAVEAMVLTSAARLVAFLLLARAADAPCFALPNPPLGVEP